MPTKLERLQEPELFFGFVSPVGTDLTSSIQAFSKYFQSKGYKVFVIRITSLFLILQNYIKPNLPLSRKTEYVRYKTFIEYGNQLREHFSDDAILAVSAIARIAKARTRLPKDHPSYEKTVFLINQFKRKEEIDILRSVYGRLFFQISVYSRRGARIEYLARKFASSEHKVGPFRNRDQAEEIVGIDENQADKKHGQRVGKIFHDADYIINLDAPVSTESQVGRFCELIFSSNSISPNKSEYGMFLAKAAALRTLDLSRQVGAAIFSHQGEIVSLGANEVPKAGGGTYWCDDPFDDREYKHEIDSNEVRKKEILTDLLANFPEIQNIQEKMKEANIIDSQFMDALEYGRIVHAEMSAISDAARLGRITKDTILFCTTFPCHMCAKHIIAAGIKEVVFLEPYPKSLAFYLHADAMAVEGSDRGQYATYPSVEFNHFFGVTPRRYRELFERTSRKENGRFQEYVGGKPRVLIDIKSPYYGDLEERAINLQEPLIRKLLANGDEDT